jgi:hypothetical protein
MTSGALADAVLAVLARDRDVTASEAAAIARLAAVDDAVAEVQLDPPDGALVPVIGFAAPGTRALLGEPALDGWLDAIAPSASQWGIKLGAPRQIYARGRFEAAQAAEVVTACTSDELARSLAVVGAEAFSMLGVELDRGAITHHVGYVAVVGAAPAEALAAARGVPLTEEPSTHAASGGRALRERQALGDAGRAFSAHAALPAFRTFLAPAREWLHLSWDLATATGLFKIDAGPRRSADAITLAHQLGLDGAALAARLAALQLGDPSHVGLRIGAPPSRALALYFRITAS